MTGPPPPGTENLPPDPPTHNDAPPEAVPSPTTAPRKRRGPGKRGLGIAAGTLAVLVGAAGVIWYQLDQPTGAEPLRLGYLYDPSNPPTPHYSDRDDHDSENPHERRITAVEEARQDINAAGGVTGRRLMPTAQEAGPRDAFATDPSASEARALLNQEFPVQAVVDPDVNLHGTNQARITSSDVAVCHGSASGAPDTDPGPAGPDTHLVDYTFQTVPRSFNEPYGTLLAEEIRTDGHATVAIAYDSARPTASNDRGLPQRGTEPEQTEDHTERDTDEDTDEYESPEQTWAEELVAELDGTDVDVVLEEDFDPDAPTDYSSVMQDLADADADATVILDTTPSGEVLWELWAAGVSATDTYTLGSTTVSPPDDESPEDGAGLTQVNTPPEDTDDHAGPHYDCVITLALAAESAGSTRAEDFVSEMSEVTGDGTECRSYAECHELLSAGEEISYWGESGPIAFTEEGFVGIHPFEISTLDEDGRTDSVRVETVDVREST
ncbi:hypothetical protein RIF23_18640 [Lipingzhangella sp. LS1_29]|uniref:Uncharacterized protein n=1 Tax=Lipingzhangella rawalii TaxID=2055835 RepID=A0ABU2HAM0_9ACTN|nr:hypothetical protein [Lipingzhangella rawalii]MDS1272311.1 hypothetical protein [Lipingzhangella rawalii]